MSNSLFSNGHALLIGVGADLPVTVNDATSLFHLFIDPKRAAYPPTQTKLLTGKQANKKHILEELDILAQKSDPNKSTVIIYFSGHGGYVEQDEEIDRDRFYLVPNGFDKTKETIITEDLFIEKVNKIQAKKLVIILDCCHASGMTQINLSPKEGSAKTITLTVRPSIESLANKLSQGEGRVILAACRETQKSYTGKPNSIFTQCLLEVLEGKSPKQNDEEHVKILTIIEYLFEEVSKRTTDKSIYKHGVQEPLVPQITNLSKNFALCAISEEVKEQIRRSKPSDIDIMVNKGRIRAFQGELEVYIEKEIYLRKNIGAIPAGDHNFHLEMSLMRTANKIDELQEKINKLSE